MCATQTDGSNISVWVLFCVASIGGMYNIHTGYMLSDVMFGGWLVT